MHPQYGEKRLLTRPSRVSCGWMTLPVLFMCLQPQCTPGTIQHRKPSLTTARYHAALVEELAQGAAYPVKVSQQQAGAASAGHRPDACSNVNVNL